MSAMFGVKLLVDRHQAVVQDGQKPAMACLISTKALSWYLRHLQHEETVDVYFNEETKDGLLVIGMVTPAKGNALTPVAVTAQGKPAKGTPKAKPEGKTAALRKLAESLFPKDDD